MSDRDSPALAQQAALAVLVGAALGVFALSRGFAAWPFVLVLPLASVRSRLPRLPPGVAAVVLHASTAMLLTTIVIGFIVALYPVVPERTTTALIRACGGALAVLASVLLFGTRIWPAKRGVVPAALGVLTAVAVDARETAASAGVAALLVLAFAAVVAWLVESGRPRGAPAGRAWARAAVFGGGALALALGLVRLLPWAQPKVENAAVGMFIESGGRSYSGLSAESRLGDIEQLALSPRVVLRVWSTEPQNLRAHVLTRFDGRTWSSPRSPERILAPAPPPIDPGLQSWLQAIPGSTFAAGAADEPIQDLTPSRIVAVGSGLPLVSPSRPRLVRAPMAVRANSLGVLRASGPAEIYGVANTRPPSTDLPGVLPPENDAALSEALSLPSVVDPRLRALAAELGAANATPRLRLQRTVGYFQANFRYSLKVGPFRTRDPVAEFVFDKKKGYCEYFASASALLLRLQGVPTRYVTGFSVRSANFSAGHYVVREADAHAWVEAYLPGLGWIEADPTPPGDYEEVHAGLQGGLLAGGLEWLKGCWAEIAARLRSVGWANALGWVSRELMRLLGARTWIVVVAAVTALAFAGRALLRRFFARAKRAMAIAPGERIPADVQELIRGLDRAWVRRGCPRPPSRAPLEHLRGLSEDKAPPALRALAEDVLLAVYAALFAGRPLSSAESARLRTLVGQIRE